MRGTFSCNRHQKLTHNPVPRYPLCKIRPKDHNRSRSRLVLVDSFQDDSPGCTYIGDQYLLDNNYQHDRHPSPYCCEESFLKWDHHPHYQQGARGWHLCLFLVLLTFFSLELLLVILVICCLLQLSVTGRDLQTK